MVILVTILFLLPHPYLPLEETEAQMCLSILSSRVAEEELEFGSASFRSQDYSLLRLGFKKFSSGQLHGPKDAEPLSTGTQKES